MTYSKTASEARWPPQFSLWMLFRLAAVSLHCWLAFKYRPGIKKGSFVPLSSKVFAISFSGFRISTTANRPSGKTKQNKLHNTQSHCSELWKDTNCILLKSFFFFLRIFNCLSLKEKNKYNPTCYDKSDTKIFFFKWNKGTKTWEAATQHVWCIF